MRGASTCLPLVAGALASCSPAQRPAAAAASAAPDAAAAVRCIALAPEPSTPPFETLPPTPVAQCDYGVDALIEGFAGLLDLRGRLEVETVEDALGLPPMSAQLRDSRHASYWMKIVGGAAEDPWQARLDFRESFFPLYDFLPPRMGGGARPRPIEAGDHGEIYFDLRVHPPKLRPAACLSYRQLIARAVAHGWLDDNDRPLPTLHGRPQAVSLTRGDLTLFPYLYTYGGVTNARGIDDCVHSVRIDQAPTRPDPPLTPEQRQRAERSD